MDTVSVPFYKRDVAVNNLHDDLAELTSIE